jgi:NADH dehydrogenase
MPDPQHVVILGGGFAGLNAARRLRRAPVHITLIDRRNFHLFQPLLYQVASGGLSPGDISSPLRSVLKRQRNLRVLQAEVEDIDVAAHEVLADGKPIHYDLLIMATGARHHYFGNDHWEELAPGLKTVEDALEMRRRILTAFERAEWESDPPRREEWMTFVIVGGGPTGVELAGTLGELAQHTLRRDFRNIDTRNAKIIVLEAGPQILNGYPADLSRKAVRELEQLGITVRTGTLVTDIHEDIVHTRVGDRDEDIPTRTVLWAAGVKASPLASRLAEQSGAALDRAGRVVIEPDLTLPGHPEVFVLGDTASFSHQGGQPLPGVAPVAVQQGRYAAKVIRNRLSGKPAPPPFHYRDQGNLAVIGRGAAVAEVAGLRFGGLMAWWIWLFVHLMNLVEFENRLLVFTQWAWNYWTRNRSARLITETPASTHDRHRPALTEPATGKTA